MADTETQGERQGPEIALVLGSGGARGLAHIGVIRELEARGYRIRAVSGSSMGALVGGIHALGALDAYEQWVCTLEQSDVFGLVDWTLSGGGLIRGEALMRKLRELLGERDIETLPIDYTAVAVDIERGREVWFTEGPLLEAIRASIAIPGLFVPHQYAGRTLVDGGLLNPIPVAPTLRTHTELTVVVDANAEPRGGLPPVPDTAAIAAQESTEGGWWDRLRGYVRGLAGDDEPVEREMAVSDLLLRSLETMQTTLTRHHLAVFRPDLTIGIPKDACMLHEFHRAAEMIELGRELTRQALERGPH